MSKDDVKLDNIATKLDTLLGAITSLVDVMRSKTPIDTTSTDIAEKPKKRGRPKSKPVTSDQTNKKASIYFTHNEFLNMEEKDACEEDKKIDKILNKKKGSKQRKKVITRTNKINVVCRKCGKTFLEPSQLVDNFYTCNNCS